MSRTKGSQTAKNQNNHNNNGGTKSKQSRRNKQNNNPQNHQNLKTKSPRTSQHSNERHWREIEGNRLYAERRYLDPLEQAVPFFYTMHSIWALLFALVPTLVIAFCFPPQTMSEATKAVLYLGMWYYLIIGAMIFPSGPFIRPHPILWRIVFSISLLYLFVLLIILLLPERDENGDPFVQKHFIPFILNDSTLGKPLQLPDYAKDCTLNWANFSSKLDRFVLAHFLGWFFKAILLRHRFLLWSMSLMWELIELSMVYCVPNFGECWWDSYFMDFLLCNGLGIEIGLLWCQWWANHQEYDWSPLLNGLTIFDKFKNYFKGTAIMFLTPERWRPTQWEPYANSKRFFQIHLIMLFMCAIDLNAFLLKLWLWIPTQHWFNLARMILFWFVCMPAVRQYYFYVKDERIKRMGSQIWVLIMLVVLETAIVIKFTPIDTPSPPWVNVIAWTVAGVVYLAWNYVMCTQVKPRSRH